MNRLSKSLWATVWFLLLLLLTYGLHVKFFRVDVVFYAAIADGLIAAALMGLALFVLKFYKPLTGLERSQLIVIWALMGYAFAISVPTVIDRSLSFYILEKLQQRGGAIQADAFEYVFTKEYVKEHRLVDVRLTEQLASGTIVIENGCAVLTDKGQILVKISRYFRMNWLPKERLLMGEYTDDLTDPFRSSDLNPDYLCKK
jgi:hypothetical protein